MNRIRRVGAVFLMVACLVAGSSGCSSEKPMSFGSGSGVLLTADEIGGQRVDLEYKDQRAVSVCGPDWYYVPREYSWGLDLHDVARIDTDDRSVVLAVLPAGREKAIRSFDAMVGGIDPECATRLWEQRRFEFTELEGFSYDPFAFRMVAWSRRSAEYTVPDVPVREKGIEVIATARAYGVVDGHMVMVRINVTDDSVEPPTEEELRTLWDAQVEKILQYSSSEDPQS